MKPSAILVWIESVRNLLNFTRENIPVILAAQTISPEDAAMIMGTIVTSSEVLDDFVKTEFAGDKELLSSRCALLLDLWEKQSINLSPQAAKTVREISDLYKFSQAYDRKTAESPARFKIVT